MAPRRRGKRTGWGSLALCLSGAGLGLWASSACDEETVGTSYATCPNEARGPLEGSPCPEVGLRCTYSYWDPAGCQTELVAICEQSGWRREGGCTPYVGGAGGSSGGAGGVSGGGGMGGTGTAGMGGAGVGGFGGLGGFF